MTGIVLLMIGAALILPAVWPELERGLRHVFSRHCEHGITWDQYCVPCRAWRDRRR